MTGLTRREWLAGAAALGAGLALAGEPAFAAGPVVERRDLYPQGVASGDPDHHSVILWTRHAPADAPVTLRVEVAEDEDFHHVVARGERRIDGNTDWTCRFLAAGLRPARVFWYRFVDSTGAASRIGRTLTAPAPDDPRLVSFAFVSCQDVTQGACNAYRRMIFEDERKPRAEQLGFVLHLGDFFYEMVWYPEDSPTGRLRGRRLRDIVRYPHGEKIRTFHVPNSLDDYRAAYRGYLTDPDLQDARARWPFVAIWDNHEFSWQGWQSQRVFFGETRPAQSLKVAANQAWFEFQPARVSQPSGQRLDRFVAPTVSDRPVSDVDSLGTGTDPDNLAAIHSLKIYRALKYGANVELVLTDNRSFMAESFDWSPFVPHGFDMIPEGVARTLDPGRAFAGGHPPATVEYAGAQVPNPRKDSPPQSYLGVEQKQWLMRTLRESRAPWKIWGHSFGTLDYRLDPQNLPDDLRQGWPGGYGIQRAGYYADHDEIFDLVRDHVPGFVVVAGDRHSFWAGVTSKNLPPYGFEPVGLHFITGSISAQTGAEVSELVVPRDARLRALEVWDSPHGPDGRAANVAALHGVRSALALQETGDFERAKAVSNPEVSPHLSFLDVGGHGYAVVRAAPTALETEFVCIPRPFERATTPDGGPLVYRVTFHSNLWRQGERPHMEIQVNEGDVTAFT